MSTVVSGERATLSCLVAIGRAADLAAFGSAGLDSSRACRTIRIGPLMAVVADVLAEDLIGPRAERLLADAEWLAPRALAHDAAIRAAWSLGPVLPIPFGTAFLTDRSMVERIESHERSIHSFLDRTEGCAERPVRVELLRERALAVIAEAASGSQSDMVGDGAAYLLGRRAHVRAIDALHEHIERWVVHASDTLEPAAADAVERELVRAGDDATVRSWAFLVERGAMDRFEESAARCATRLEAQGLRLHIGEAMPPYSFCPSMDDPIE